MGKFLTLSEILKKSSLLKSLTYGKIENFLLCGLIIESEKTLKHSKRIPKYTCIFAKISILVKNDRILV